MDEGKEIFGLACILYKNKEFNLLWHDCIYLAEQIVKQGYCEQSNSEKYTDVGYRKLESMVFQEYDINEVESRDACEYHAMTSEHTEVLGQFLDYSGMDIEQLKKCLIAGYYRLCEESK